ncbi:MAG: CHAD domain-containing protein [Magnetococcales bacterium]|nr:CHAD domain-containing protein [Magnetococcales bacterium]
MDGIGTLRFRASDPRAAANIPEQWPLVRAAAVGPVKETTETSTYFDTPTMTLWRHGLLVLLRRRNDHSWRQIIQPRRSWLHEPLFPAWMTSRLSCDSGVLNLELLQRELEYLFKKAPSIVVGDLQPVVHITCSKRRWLLEFPDSRRIELLEEKGHITTPLRQDHHKDDCQDVCCDQLFHEIVIKTTRGELDAWMFQRALTLAQAWEPAFVSASPLERAFWSYGVIPDPRSPAPDLALSADTPLEATFVRLCQFLWQQLVDAHALINDGDAVSGRLGLQELLKAVTQLRMLSAAYASLITDDARDQIDAELEWLSDALVPADQWQNFLEQGWQPFAALEPPQSAELLRLQQRVLLRNEDYFNQVRSLLNSFRFTRLLLGLGYWLHGRLWRYRLDHRQRKQLQVHMAPSVTVVMDRHYHRLLQMHERISGIDWATGRAIREKGEMLHALVDLFVVALRRHVTGNTFSHHLGQFCQLLRKIDYLHRFCSQFGQISPDTENQINTRFYEWVQTQTRRTATDAEQKWADLIRCQPFWSKSKGDTERGQSRDG